MKQMLLHAVRFLRGQGCRGGCLVLCLAFAAAFFPPPAFAYGSQMPIDPNRAAGELANLVIAVKFADTAQATGTTQPSDRDTDVFALASAWAVVRQTYDTAENSFSRYIDAVSEHKLAIYNYFPQELTGQPAVLFRLMEADGEEGPLEESLPQPGEEPLPQPSEEPMPQPSEEPTPQPSGEPMPQPSEGAGGLPKVQPGPPSGPADVQMGQLFARGQTAGEEGLSAQADAGSPRCVSLQLAHDAAYYAESTAREQEMIAEIAAAIQAQALQIPDSAALDRNHDGALDTLTLLLPDARGPGESERFTAHSSVYGGDARFGSLEVLHYNLITAKDFFNLSSIGGGPGLLAHEFLHTLGLPDLYRLGGGASAAPVGYWSIMANANKSPQYPLEYLREQLGWIGSIPVLEPAGGLRTVTLRLPNLQSPQSSAPTAYKIKTPLSDTEFFVLEYRSDQVGGTVFDKNLLKAQGLLIYRVDTAVAGQTNFHGENYIYLFRPRQSGNTETNDVNSPVINAPCRSAYGSTDLSAGAGNTLFYSSGQNSGVAIRDIVLNGEELTFTVDFADYSAGGELWETTGSQIDDVQAYGVSMAACDGALYLTSTTPKTYPAGLTLWKSADRGASFTAVGSLSGLAGGFDSALYVYNGELFLATQAGKNAQPVVYRFTGGSLQEVYRGTDEYAREPRLFEYEGGLCLAYTLNNVTLCVKKVSGGRPLELRYDNMINPALGVCQGRLIAVYGQSGATSKVAEYTNGGWVQLLDTGIAGGNQHAIAVNGGTLTVFADYNKQHALWAYNGSSWARLPALPELDGKGVYGLSLFYNGQKLYAGLVETPGNVLRLVGWDGSAWQQLGGSIANSVLSANPAATVLGSDFYLAYVTQNNSLIVRRHSGAQPADPTPAPDYTVSLALGSAAAAETVYVDGVAYRAACQNGGVSVRLPNGAARTVTWYPTDPKGTPTGMRVWLLSFANGRYTAAEQTALRDLLTYHGFSIRISGAAGIRFKTGISLSAKAALQSAGGLDGFRLVEYGTLVMNQKNAAAYPFILGCEKVASGRCYWIQDGIVQDKVFETVSGRQRFTSVLVDIPSSRYKTEYAFRGYIILQKGGQQYTLYGPPVARSIYYLAQRLIDRQDYVVGSREDAFLREIIRAGDAA